MTNKHYEIVLLFHPDFTDQIPSLLDLALEPLKSAGGLIHRQEDWGRRSLAYPIKKIQKAHYMLLNVETSSEQIEQLREHFRFHPSVLRTLFVRVKSAITQPSIVLKPAEEKNSLAN